MESIILLKDQYYILATSERADLRTHTLKHDETFGVFDRFGDILRLGMREQGIYHMGTRHVSNWELLIEEQRPLLLSSGMREDNNVLSADLTNPDIITDHFTLVRNTIHLHRSKFIWKTIFYESIYLINFGLEPASIRFGISFDADFADVFEVRGMKRTRRGEPLDPVPGERDILLAYQGLDAVTRTTRFLFSDPPIQLDEKKAIFEVHLTPKQREVLRIAVHFGHVDKRGFYQTGWEEAFILATETGKAKAARACRLSSSNASFDTWCTTSLSDIHMMLTATAHGNYPYAGVPWFNAAFGRDGIIAAMECLWIEPDIAKDVLMFLAAYQADAVIPRQDAEPGKIIHEVRFGEMAALGEIPFGTYYGSVDATPLFIVLAGYYYRRTGDLDFIRKIWPHIRRALEWINTYGDVDGDGFIEYKKHSERGLTNQGWKDSRDSVFHANGKMAEAPIALCEVQGYVYAAKIEAALLASLLGEEDFSMRLRREAEALKVNFEKAFWIEELSMYALALDGRKQPCKVRASNAGQCIFSGIGSEEHVYRIAEMLLSDSFFSGWGIRTVASSEARYNPMSYHNGSVWPHDNALIAMGFARYELTDALLKVFGGMFEATKFFDQYRLPELFCGFHRRVDSGPTVYPVACSPQTWAAGTVFMLLQSCLGISIELPNRIVFKHPVLPEFIQELSLSGLKIKDREVDLVLRRYRYNVSVEILRKTGNVELLVIK